MDTQEKNEHTEDAPETGEAAETAAAETEPTPASTDGDPSAETAPAEADSAAAEDDLPEDFATALEMWESDLQTLKEGEVVKGRVLRLLEKEVIVDIGYKSEGIIDLDEFRGLDGTLHVKEGDRIDVLLEKTEDADGYVVLSKEKAERLKIWEIGRASCRERV